MLPTPRGRSQILLEACGLEAPSLLIEPDFLPVTIAEPPEVRAFWSGWLAWSRDRGIDYHIGRTMAPRLAALGIEKIGGTAETAIYNGTSLWADYWTQTVKELRQDLTSSGKLNNALIDTLLGCCADPACGRKRSPLLQFTATPLAGSKLILHLPRGWLI